MSHPQVTQEEICELKHTGHTSFCLRNDCLALFDLRLQFLNFVLQLIDLHQVLVVVICSPTYTFSLKVIRNKNESPIRTCVGWFHSRCNATHEEKGQRHEKIQSRGLSEFFFFGSNNDATIHDSRFCGLFLSGVDVHKSDFESCLVIRRRIQRIEQPLSNQMLRVQ